MKIFFKIFHWLITFFHLIVIYYGLVSIFFHELPTDKKELDFMLMARNNLWCYFSLWGVILQIVYFLLVSMIEVSDALPSMSKTVNKWRNKVEFIRKHLFVSLVFPITICVGITFWIIYAYDREQIYPSIIDKYISPWINHAIHTVPPILVFVHYLIADLNGISTKICLMLLISFDVSYTLCFMWSGLVYGNWIYLICQAMAGEKLALALCACNLSTGIYFAVGRLIPYYVQSVKGYLQGNVHIKVK